MKTSKKLLLLATVSLINLALFGFLFFLTSKSSSLTANTEQSLRALANTILKTCMKAPYKPTCYEKEIPELMNNISMEDAFTVTKLVQDKDTSYAYCHVLGHKLSSQEVQKNPEGWKDVIARCPSGVCSNGCLHGGMQERFRSESLTDQQTEAIIPDLQSICEAKQNWSPTGLEQGSCYHALGHLTMYITKAHIASSLKICDRITKKDDGRDFSHLCYDGVFMQMYQPLEPEDFALVKGKEVKRETVSSFCNKYQGEQNVSCWTESWPLFSREIQTPVGLVKLCSRIDQDLRERCYQGMFYVISTKFNLNKKMIVDLCSKLPKDLLAKCFSNAAARFVETDYRNIDQSVALCHEAKKYNAGTLCMEELARFASYNFHPGSKEFAKMCNSLPKEWVDACKKG